VIPASASSRLSSEARQRGISFAGNMDEIVKCLG